MCKCAWERTFPPGLLSVDMSEAMCHSQWQADLYGLAKMMPGLATAECVMALTLMGSGIGSALGDWTRCMSLSMSEDRMLHVL